MTSYKTPSNIKGALMCYAETWDIYISDCFDKENANTDWIIINPFVANNTDTMLNNITADEPEAGATNVKGFIFKTDRPITSTNYYEKPQIMSEDDETNVDAYQ